MPRFVPSQLDPRRMIARTTLETLSAVLRGSGAHRLAPTPTSDVTIEVRLADHPMLARIGGVVRVDPGAGGAIAVARIGGSCFVAFEQGSEGLHELSVELDPEGHRLLVHRSPVTTGTAASPQVS